MHLIAVFQLELANCLLEWELAIKWKIKTNWLELQLVILINYLLID